MWARAEDRRQLVLFAERLDDAVPAEHTVRLLDEILGRLDWKAWEAAYHGRLGQPPIHPRVLAGVLLYGLLTRIRSSRMLEEALSVRLDFRWLAEGRRIDHTTISEFRRNHTLELRDLFVRICLLARELGFLGLARLGFDGTRVKANNRRSGTRTPDELRKMRDELKEKFGQAEKEAASADERDAEVLGPASLHELPADLKEQKTRLAKLEATLAELDRLKEEDRGVPKRVPVTDLDARLMPNKEGGFAPNYTPLATVDIASGLIVSADVLNEVREDGRLLAALDEVKRTFGPSEAVLTDGLNGTGPNLAGCRERGIEVYSPSEVADPAKNPALRADPTQPVPADQWERLPTRKQGRIGLQLAKGAFVYDAADDAYRCPMGRRLGFQKATSEAMPDGGRLVRRRYRSEASACADCPLKGRCLGGKLPTREVTRDQFDADRERLAARMGTEAGRAVYALRRSPGERPFAIIKHQFGLRQMLLRGLDRVRDEWRWAASAFNLHRLMALIRGSRAGPPPPALAPA